MVGKMTGLVLLCCLVAISQAVSATRTKRADAEDGETYSVTTIQEPPYVIWDAEKEGNAKAGGFVPELFKKLAEEAGIKYDIKLVGDGHYGSKATGGTWNGMIGELVTGDADIVAAPLTVTDNRKEVVDFSEAYMSISITILLKKGNSTISSMKDLADQTDVKYGLVRDGVTEAFFSDPDADPVYKKMWQAMSSDQSLLMQSIEDGVKKVRESKGKYAFLIESETANYWTNQEPCDLVSTGMLPEKKDYAFAFSKQAEGQAAKTKINTALAALKSKGEIENIKKKFWNGGQCNASATSLPAAVLPLVSLAAILVNYFRG